jgi:hypothetical protein
MRNLRSPNAQRPATRGHLGQVQASHPHWTPWAKAWLGMVVIAFVNGVLHRGYEGALGELRAHQLSTAVLLLLLAPWVWWSERRHPLPTTRAATQVGLVLGDRHGGLRVRLRPLRDQGQLGHLAA